MSLLSEIRAKVKAYDLLLWDDANNGREARKPTAADYDALMGLITHGEEGHVLTLTDAERNIIIAALRLWQRSEFIPNDIEDLARDHDPDGPCLDDAAIDDLIEKKVNI